jgi:hypothetical protein
LGQLAHDSSRRLSLAAQHVLSEIADDFVESVTAFAAEIAKHRGSNVLSTRDLQRMCFSLFAVLSVGWVSSLPFAVHLRLNWGIDLPLPDDEPLQKRARTDEDTVPPAPPPLVATQQQQPGPVHGAPQKPPSTATEEKSIHSQRMTIKGKLMQSLATNK